MKMKFIILLMAFLGFFHVCPAQQYLVEVEALDHSYDIDAGQEIPSGWITFALNNSMSEEIHEISLVRLPEGITHDDYLGPYMLAWSTLLKEFQEGKVVREGINDRVNEMLPDWSGKLKYVSSRGLISPGRTAWRTVNLEPGNYSMVCWMKAEDGEIHIMKGMSRALKVSEEKAAVSEPKPKAKLVLSGKQIKTEWIAERGKHEFKFDVSKKEKSIPANIHLIKLEGDTDLDEVHNWMDWYKINGLRTPVGVEFLGGLEYSGSVDGYFSVDIKEPGEYAWIVCDHKGSGLYKRFSVK